MEEDKEKIHMIYIEVKYAKASSGMSNNKSMFQLKKDGKLLTSYHYQDGLLRYNESTQRTKTLSMADLSNVLAVLNGKKFLIFPI